MNDSFAAVSKEEAYELLGKMETYLVELEKMPDDEALVRRTFRALHTIKGSGAMFGFERVAKFTHEVETVFDLVRDRKIVLTKPLVELSLTACDIIRSMLDNAGCGEGRADDRRIAEVVESLRKLASGNDGGEPSRRSESPPSKAQPAERVDKPGKKSYYRIRFRPGPDILKTGANPIRLLDEMREMGELAAFAHLESIPDLDRIDPEIMYCYWDLVLISDRDIGAVRDVFMFVEDGSEIDIGVLDESSRWGDDQETEKLGQILVRRGDVDPGALESVLGKRKLIGETLVEAGLVTPAKVASALVEQQYIREAGKERQAVEGKHEGGEVWIIIKDDGRGLSRERILAGAVKRGLVEGDGVGMSDNEVFQRGQILDRIALVAQNQGECPHACSTGGMIVIHGLQGDQLWFG